MCESPIYTHRIGLEGPLWYLQEKRKFWFFTYWKTILVTPYYEECINEIRDISPLFSQK